MIGRTLGHYRIDSQLGRGGMGVVYRARDSRLERDVALKVLPAGLLTDEGARKRFRKEALALSQLNHPNIATVHDFDTEEGVDLLVLEYIAGVSLDEKLAAGPLAEKELLGLATQLALGLAAAHEQAIVHRDLKPGNLRITTDGRLKILDFGLATLVRPQGEAASTVSMTEGPTVAGTVPYMAPEQLRGEKADARADLHAAGAVLYEMATGRRAFPQAGGPQIIAAILQEMPPSPATLNPRVSSALEGIILKCLDKEPERRYQTARELRVDLERLSAPAPVTGPVPRARRRRWLVPAAAAVLAVLALVAWWALRPAAQQRIESLAVLPLDNLSGDSAQDYFSDGMTEALITDLGKIASLRVISRSAVMKYKKERPPLMQIARELKVDALVEGAVLRSGERVRITSRLMHPASDRQLWSESYERDLRDVLALQGEVARAVVSQIRTRLSSSEQPRLATARPVNPQAYELYLRGSFLASRFAKDDTQAAIQTLERAVALDPNFAAAHAALARAWRDRTWFHAPEETKELEPKALAAVERALSLDPDLAEAYVTRARLIWTPSNQWAPERAVPDLRRALELNPNSDEALGWLSAIHSHTGLLEEGFREAQQGASINPASTVALRQTAHILLYQGNAEAALPVYRSIPRQTLPSFIGSHNAWARFRLGRKQEALATIEEFLRDFPEDSSGALAAMKALLLADAGDVRQTEAAIRSAENKKAFADFHHTSYLLACAYARLNRPRPAIDWLEYTARTGFPCYPLFERDPNLDPLRQDPRFVQFLAAEKKRWEHNKVALSR